jgi:hypothetical protein
VFKKSKATIPATAGKILSYKGEGAKYLSMAKQREFRSGVGKLLHLAKWSRPEIKNSVRELSRGMTQATEEAYLAMQRVMAYCVDTPKRGLLLAPKGTWNGDNSDELVVKGMSDTTYASDYDTRRSVMGRMTFLNEAPVIIRSKMQQYVDLSVTESELGGATETAQDMLFVMQIVESMGLKVKKPMILYLDNKGAKDLANSWSVGGRTRHIEVRQYFLRELKEQGLIQCVWTSGVLMTSDILTKNLSQDIFERHAKVFCGTDEYMKTKNEVGNIQVDEDVGSHMTPTWYLDWSL